MMRAFRFNRRDYQWRQDGDRWELSTGGQCVARVAPDQVYPSMWRIALGGALSDIVNLSRAKDAAVVLADRAIENGRLRTASGPPMRFGANKRIARRASKQPSPSSFTSTAPQTIESAASGRLGLVDLKRAAAPRKGAPS